MTRFREKETCKKIKNSQEKIFLIFLKKVLTTALIRVILSSESRKETARTALRSRAGKKKRGKREMKQVLITLVLYVVLAFAIFSMACVAIDKATQTYSEVMTVVETESDLVWVMNKEGDVFSFYGDGFSVGESVVATVNGRGTRTRMDDVIVDAVSLS